MNKPFDILIAGGGLVGSSLAIALEGSGYRIALVESAPPQVNLQPSYDERNLALARASVNALIALGVWNYIDTQVMPIQRIHVSRHGDFGAVRLDASALSLPSFGAVISARELGNALLKRLSECQHLVRYTPAQVIDVTDADASVMSVTLRAAQDVHTVQTRLLVGADGTESFVRSALGIATQRYDYGQSAIVTTLTTEQSLNGCAYERFTNSGPVALLPLAHNLAGLVLTVPTQDAERIATYDDVTFLDFVHACFGYRVGRLSKPGKRKPYPLIRVLADSVIAPRTVLVGNAAQTMHPIGAQGFNLGLRDALALAELLREPLILQADPGEAVLLKHYAQRRANDRSATTAFSDNLVRLMGNNELPLRLLRSLGFFALDRISPLKQHLALRGMGFRDNTPKLALSL